MSVIIEIAVPAAEFALGRSLESIESTQFELERMVPTTDAVVPFFWAHDADPAALETTLEADEDVIGVRMLDELDSRTLFRVEWVPDINGLVRSIIEHDAAILEAIGTNDRWEFQLRFPDDTSVSTFRTTLGESDVTFELRRMYNPDDPETDVSGLTPAQRETLLLALEGGYFSIPRETNLVELADELDISDQAVNERMRRGMTKLVAASLTAGSDAE
ncbi:helix-turn-helix domain-containing protein [Halococcus agarilyticus]|uniref:helix-turn-helix domain-containing protein n=1 Tax=Halococcus agarilyticus TaxID=1232219 RepID=UPI000677BA05|nr:bacterio-opsin activator domain-containing protein [Halococcus agarilyticus]